MIAGQVTDRMGTAGRLTESTVIVNMVTTGHLTAVRVTAGGLNPGRGPVGRVINSRTKVNLLCQKSGANKRPLQPQFAQMGLGCGPTRNGQSTGLCPKARILHSPANLIPAYRRTPSLEREKGQALAAPTPQSSSFLFPTQSPIYRRQSTSADDTPL